MNNIKSSFCRLCAELKLYIDLKDLNTDETAREEVLNKLIRLSCHIDFNQNNLPLTVCSRCMNTLNIAYDFVIAVQSAQLELIVIEAVKLETVSSDNESVTCESPYKNSNDNYVNIVSSGDVILDDGADSNIKSVDKVLAVQSDQLKLTPKEAVKLEIDSTDNKSAAYSGYEYSNDNNGETLSSCGVTLNEGPYSSNKLENKVISTAPHTLEHTISEAGNPKEDVLAPAVKLEIVSSDNERVEHSNDDDNETTSSSDGMLNDSADSNNKLKDKEVSTVPQTVEQSNISQEGNQKKDVSDPGTTLEPKLTWSDYKWTCSYCQIQYSNLFELKTHSMEQHQACNPLSCTDCKSRYLRLDNFIKHICEHRKYLKLTCLICREEFKTVIGLNIHKFSHFEHKYKCDGCNSCFNSIYKLHKHMKMYYKNAYSRYLRGEPQSDDLVCRICKKKLKTKRSYKRHISVHTNRKRNFTCDVCGKSFMTKDKLYIHVIRHNKSNTFICDICNSALTTRDGLVLHIRKHSGIKPFSCETCGKSFFTQHFLKNHSIVHTDSFPYSCSYCDKRFKLKTHLRLHLRQHTGEKPYTCNICNKGFTYRSNYSKHMKDIHNYIHNTSTAKKIKQ